MWMDVHVQEILIRQQIVESDRTAVVRHLLQVARSSGPRRPWRAMIQRFVRTAATSRPRRPAERVAVR